MNILITGAAGFIGSHAAERFKQLGHRVIGVDNFSSYYDVRLKKRNAEVLEDQDIEMIALDLRTDALMELLPNKIDYIIHFSAHPGISQMSTFNDYLSNNVGATQNLLHWTLGLKRKPYFINIATSSIYGLEATLSEDQATSPASWYGVTKLAAEQLVLSYIRKKELKGTSLRLYSVYGPRERPDKLYTKLLDCGINNKEFSLYEGSEKHLRSYTYVQDIIDGIVSVLGKEDLCNGEIFNLGTDVENTTAHGIQIIEALLNVTIKKQILPPRQGDQLRTRANIDKARKVLNYNPTTKLKEGLKEQLKWFKENNY
ncbi:NAD-dependent epimerase/dehydratase family protein [Seonamhaeicola sediminis]|uniref:NAD-dependent epimerase/dehydratase family protein n=1 Tax=Seonamhaeicola sediminis TaxID=2528206 RepID=A0A562YHW8_9FLAO|nr:NAD-dependent epimerase/dehydratase family protein [Seonamhaeicola sediminis]TWO34358.1 NAD-dependent epimerase/dehydratase family protein [Seonamhaeicola sediminis]